MPPAVSPEDGKILGWFGWRLIALSETVSEETTAGANSCLGESAIPKGILVG
jgi:hypothetical protein